MSESRKFVICKECNKEKMHFGKGYCSACLRHIKRKTNPKFYLGTCYSELSRRCKTYDPLRPNYVGLAKCTKAEFFDRFVGDVIFLELYKNWQDSNFARAFAPSIDRIDNSGDYTISNLQFIVQSVNSVKDKSYAIQVDNKEFESQVQASRHIGISPALLCRMLKEKDEIEYYGIQIKRI